MTTDRMGEEPAGPAPIRTLRLAVEASASSAGAVEFVREAERLGVHAAWAAEMWGYDAFTQLGYLAAQTSTIRLGTSIVPLGARTPAMLAMSAMSLQQLTGGRFTLGIGATAAIFSVVDAVLLRLPYRAPQRLVTVFEDASEVGFERNTPVKKVCPEESPQVKPRSASVPAVS